MYSLSRSEQETIIRWDAEARACSIDTADPVVIRKLDRLVEQHPNTYRCVRVDALYNAKRYEVPARYIRFGKPATDAQREQGKAAASNLRRKLTGNAGV